ncbi:MAG: SRPBCC family protein [Egibacteraceae bacterium]
MTVAFELFTVGLAPVDEVWGRVSDPWRLTEWTDAEQVERVNGDPMRVGSEIVVVTDGQRLLWRVDTVEPRLWEASADVPAGRLHLGVRVARDPLGTRLILAALLEPSRSAWRARLLTVPALRRRLERWCEAALRPDGAAQ